MVSAVFLFIVLSVFQAFDGVKCIEILPNSIAKHNISHVETPSCFYPSPVDLDLKTSLKNSFNVRASKSILQHTLNHSFILQTALSPLYHQNTSKHPLIILPRQKETTYSGPVIALTIVLLLSAVLF
ncbi:hypothetical protein BDF14DRAFT_1120772 [Spinellus fusiger]|nr:hypothetical protein BDF14DRAFT_1120772 [Spinellus fusiger]